MRACCVIGCKTGGRMPTHGIPKNKKRRIDWLQRLRLTEQDENIINILRVCYKHFKDSDYTCSVRRRRLIDTAFPSIDIDMFEDHTYAKTYPVQQRTDVPQQDIVSAVVSQQQLQEKQICNTGIQVEEIITNHDITMQHGHSIQTLQHTVEIIKEKLQTLQDKTQQKMHAYDQKMQALDQKIQAHDQSIQLLEEAMYMMKQKHAANQGEQREIKATKRPYLVKQITRKRKLSLTAIKLYDNNIKLRKEMKRLKKRVANLKKELKSKAIILNATDNKDRTDESTVMG